MTSCCFTPSSLSFDYVSFASAVFKRHTYNASGVCDDLPSIEGFERGDRVAAEREMDLAFADLPDVLGRDVGAL